MPRVVVRCECCHFEKAFMGETWEHVCNQVASDFVWPLCRTCFNGYERSLIETAQVHRVAVVRDMMTNWV